LALASRSIASKTDALMSRSYETGPSETLERDLRACVRETGPPAWVVFFSPSAVHAALPMLKVCEKNRVPRALVKAARRWCWVNAANGFTDEHDWIHADGLYRGPPVDYTTYTTDGED